MGLCESSKQGSENKTITNILTVGFGDQTTAAGTGGPLKSTGTEGFGRTLFPLGGKKELLHYLFLKK